MPKKEKQPTLEELRQERNKLMISKQNPERLSEVKGLIDYWEYGIKIK